MAWDPRAKAIKASQSSWEALWEKVWDPGAKGMQNRWLKELMSNPLE